MSHFSVCVRVPDSLVASTGSIDAAVTKMMAPYQENNMGDCPEEFLEFNDVTAEKEADYKTDTCSMVRLVSGEVCGAFEERFKNETKSIFDHSAPNYVYPGCSEQFEMPVSERYPSFDDYVTEYCGYTKDAKTGRYGDWESPNKKWDYWRIGGRWGGFFPIKAGSEVRVMPAAWDSGKIREGYADVARLNEIDFDKIGSETHERAEKFWDEWQRLLGGEKFPAFEGTRDKAMRIGLLEVNRGALSEDEKTRCLSWKGFVQDGDERSAWHDVYKVITREEFLRDYLISFNPVSTFARLDESGWHEAGEMGWFGISSDTPETYMQQVKDFPSWMRETGDAWLVVVDCHI